MQICSKNPVRSALLLFAVLAALALAACGSDDSSSSDEGPDPASVAPADTGLYFEAVVRPEGEQKDELVAGLSKLLNTDDPGAMITSAIESATATQGFPYSENIEPWLGQRAGAFLSGSSGSDGALVLAVTDQAAAEDAIQKAADVDNEPERDETYEGVTYKVDNNGSAVGIVSDFLVAGTEDGVKAAIDASSADSLADNSDAMAALDSAPSDSLFRTYVDPTKLIDLAVEAGAVTQKDLDAASGQLDALYAAPVVISGAAASDSMSLEVSGAASDSQEGTDIVSTLPGDSWFAFGAPMVGQAIASGVDQALANVQSSLSEIPGADFPGGQLPDVQGELQQALGIDLSKDLAWIGDLGAFVKGSSLLGLGGGIVIETDDEQAANAALAKLRKALAGEPDLQISDTADGFQISAGPAGAEVAVSDGKVVIAIAGTTVDEVLSPSETLADASGFQSASGALGDDLTTALYVDFPTIVGLAESSGQTGDPGYQQAKPVLDALAYLVAGGGTSDDRSIGRIVLGLQEPSGDAPAAVIAP